MNIPKIIAIIPRGSHTSSILTSIFTFSQSGSNRARIDPEVNPIIAAPKTRFTGSNTLGSHPIAEEKRSGMKKNDKPKINPIIMWKMNVFLNHFEYSANLNTKFDLIS